ncbi:cytochrome P450 [Streptomyces sp. NPDC102360]|uniref:cytochrome P450 n=1 Tax=Streptomyces sp. NPDC102360 TaxID=3366160 RepID=UPI0037F897A0
MSNPPALPTQRTCPFAPIDEQVRLQGEAPIAQVTLPTGDQVWALTRHETIRKALGDARFSSDRLDPRFPGRTITTKQMTGGAKMLVAMDPPEHTAARRLLAGEFTVKRMSALEPQIQLFVDEHIDAMLAGPRPVDLVQALALPVPSLVICEMLGVPYSDHDLFQKFSNKILAPAIPVEERQQAGAGLRGYLDDLVARKEAEPADDLLGRQIAKQRELGTYDHAAMVSMALMLLVAGHETTANTIGLATVMLLEHPEQLAAVKKDPSKIPGAVEEVLRYFAVAEAGNVRLAKEDVEIDGVCVRAGEAVVALSNTGNHDPAAFENPEKFDPEREARHHLTFGYGPHQCLGQTLARIELRVVLTSLFARIPDLRLAVPLDELPFRYEGQVYGLRELPVTW